MSSSDLTDDEEPQTWIEWFCQLRGHEFFCEIDTQYIADAFNLYGLRAQVSRYKQCVELLLGVGDSASDREGQEQELYPHAKRLYGLIHARYILTSQGQKHMLHKYEFGDFGKCPRVLCGLANVLPVGEHAEMGRSSVKLYCPQCQDMYDPPRKCHRDIDGAYFGPSFPHLLMMVKPDSFQPKPFRVYTPRIYGFRVHDSGRNYPLLDRARTPAAARAQRAAATGKRRATSKKRAAAAPRAGSAGASASAATGALAAAAPRAQGTATTAWAAATAVATADNGKPAVDERASRKRKSGPQ